MTVLTIRAHKRFAVRRAASLMALAGPGGTAVPGAVPGLLIELSLEGCRLGQIDAAAFAVGERVSLTIAGFGPRAAEVRWAQNGCVGLKLSVPLHMSELDELVRGCRAFEAARVVAG